ARAAEAVEAAHGQGVLLEPVPGAGRLPTTPDYTRRRGRGGSLRAPPTAQTPGFPGVSCFGLFLEHGGVRRVGGCAGGYLPGVPGAKATSPSPPPPLPPSGGAGGEWPPAPRPFPPAPPPVK